MSIYVIACIFVAAVIILLSYIFLRRKRKTTTLTAHSDLTQTSLMPRIIGYWENWSQSYNQGWLGYPQLGMTSNCTHVVYSFLTLDPKPNPDAPNDIEWDGMAIYSNQLPVVKSTSPQSNDIEIAYTGVGSSGTVIPQIISFIQSVKKSGRVAMLALGGWSDLQKTPRFSQKSQCDRLVKFLKVMYDKLKPDGIDFDWEHLSGGTKTIEDSLDYCMGLGYIMSELKKLSVPCTYTTRSNTLYPYGAESDCEGVGVIWGASSSSLQAAISSFKNAKNPSTISRAFEGLSSPNIPWIYLSMMTYDGAVGNLLSSSNQYTFDIMNKVLNNTLNTVSKFYSTPEQAKSTILIGFEPVSQAAGGIPMDPQQRMQVIDLIAKNGWGGFILWAIKDDVRGTESENIALSGMSRFYGTNPLPSITTVKPLYGSNCTEIQIYGAVDQPWYLGPGCTNPV